MANAAIRARTLGRQVLVEILSVPRCLVGLGFGPYNLPSCPANTTVLYRRKVICDPTFA